MQAGRHVNVFIRDTAVRDLCHPSPLEWVCSQAPQRTVAGSAAPRGRALRLASQVKPSRRHMLGPTHAAHTQTSSRSRLAMVYCGCRNASGRRSNLLSCNSLGTSRLLSLLPRNLPPRVYTVCTHHVLRDIGTATTLAEFFPSTSAERIPKNKKRVWDYYRMSCLYSEHTTTRNASERIPQAARCAEVVALPTPTVVASEERTHSTGTSVTSANQMHLHAAPPAEVLGLLSLHNAGGLLR